jgi:hypothetical protein
MKFTFLTAVLLLAGCAQSGSLTADQEAKLEPRLRQLLAGENVAGVNAVKSNGGIEQYDIIIRGSSADDVRAAGVTPNSVIGEVMTARVRVDQIRTLAKITSIRSLQMGSANSIN